MPGNDEPIEAKLAQQWRMRCPEGHVDLRDNSGSTVYCRGCGRAYEYETLVDAQTDVVPVNRPD